MKPVKELIDSWREEKTLFQRYGDEEKARIFKLHADQLEDAIRMWEEELLNLQQASAESGYSAGHLGRLVREGEIPNAGREGAPRIRRRDLPMKPGTLSVEDRSAQVAGRSKEQIAQAVVDSD